ncbi:hypothetical protein LKF67_1429 [Lactococcus lactis subsp. lactis]|nr:hypothetical protein LKF67_1429 [Lactococcus lactis subsp. lactis]
MSLPEKMTKTNKHGNFIPPQYLRQLLVLMTLRVAYDFGSDIFYITSTK